jgi:D-psicose/D-tagatose/L-ribulose 3-epimerase
MPRLGIHTFVWAAEWDRAGAEAVVVQAAAAGLDLVEVPLLRPSEIDVAHGKELAARHKIALSCSLGLPAEATLPDRPAEAERFLKQALEVVAALGARYLGGVTYGTIGRLSGAAPTEAEHATIVKALQPVARRAGELGIELGLEPCNRYETHLVNTGRQTVRLIERIGEPNVGVHFDTYHMNIEEKGFEAPIVETGRHLRYIHLSESDRGVPGTGTVDWDGVFRGLARIAFAGDMVLESFVHLHPDIARALAVWRPVAAGGAAEVVAQGLPFLRRKAREHGALAA